MIDLDLTKRCPCAKQYKDGTWNPDHIHPKGDGTFFCDECNHSHKIEEAIPNE